MGTIRKVFDMTLGSHVLEISGRNSLSTFITSPVGMFQTLGVRLPYLVMVAKNMNRQFTIDIQVRWF